MQQTRRDGRARPFWVLVLIVVVVVVSVAAITLASQENEEPEVMGDEQAVDDVSPPDSQSGSDGASGAGPVLSCSGRTLPILAPNVEGVAVTCSVEGAEADHSFSLRATLAGRTGATKTIDPFCQGALQDGTGTCGGNAIEAVAYWGGSFTLSATLTPSGQTLGPAWLQLEAAP